MSDPSALTALHDARARFAAAIDGAPPESLTYLPEGADYALGGLVTHVSGVLQRYGTVLSAIVATPGSEFDAGAADAEMAARNERARDGLRPEQRQAAMEEMGELHERVAGTLRALTGAELERKTAVRYGGGGEPYPTSPSDIAGWLADHYLEHVPHVAEMLEGWRAAS